MLQKKENSYFYIKYITIIIDVYLISSKLVGKVSYHVDNSIENDAIEIENRIFFYWYFFFWGGKDTYTTNKKVKIKKIYLKNSDIVDYNIPIILVEEFSWII